VFSTQLRARVVPNCELAHFRRHVIHWLDVTGRIRFRLCVQVYKCRHSMAPGYLDDRSLPTCLQHRRSYDICDLLNVDTKAYSDYFSLGGPTYGELVKLEPITGPVVGGRTAKPPEAERGLSLRCPKNGQINSPPLYILMRSKNWHRRPRHGGDGMGGGWKRGDPHIFFLDAFVKITRVTLNSRIPSGQLYAPVPRLQVSRVRMTTNGRREFPDAGSSTWNVLSHCRQHTMCALCLLLDAIANILVLRPILLTYRARIF